MKGLTVTNLKSGYNKKTILSELSLEAKPKETLVLMGPSGSGKSTFLLTILGIVKPTHGKITLNERDITHLQIEERNIGYLPQDYGLFPHLSVIDNIAYGLRIRGEGKDQQYKRAKEMLELVELTGYEDKRIQAISGGQRQRVGLARALAIAPDLLLLDEPLSNIDQVTKLDVAKGLKDLFEKLDIPIILVTHNHEDALFLSEKLVILIDGKIEQEGTVQSIKNHPKTNLIKRLISPFE